MFRKIWNYLFGKRVRDTINLDAVAKDFVNKVFPPKSEWKEQNDLVELLDGKHFECLDREVDPLEGATEIPGDSVTSSRANIPSCGEPSEVLKRNVVEETIRPDRIKKCENPNIRTVVDKLIVEPTSKNSSTRSKRRR